MQITEPPSLAAKSRKELHRAADREDAGGRLPGRATRLDLSREFTLRRFGFALFVPNDADLVTTHVRYALSRSLNVAGIADAVWGGS
mmetsp:Transcript_1860/g.4700  ORF Transcript_1860/g.4700 Transcript_1860/m.4700 type:complete len:87 (-) Transcript_1860:2745-3005(-)|eukprot:CAMPEP_0195568844 /NCGR_PEP_ID=MMETSP0814-20130614/2482_1 /TAXON_ID=97485 /ORGANISM="Prymnesium parvum, Strain Texoma1" /LENGTH=86 /DNA_ID=CAMNT_0040704181 /DNA_START=245 /DNA_END=505 /DNA_ORIENTATION=+